MNIETRPSRFAFAAAWAYLTREYDEHRRNPARAVRIYLRYWRQIEEVREYERAQAKRARWAA